jgi:hypothetical protein
MKARLPIRISDADALRPVLELADRCEQEARALTAVAADLRKLKPGDHIGTLALIGQSHGVDIRVQLVPPARPAKRRKTRRARR